VGGASRFFLPLFFVYCTEQHLDLCNQPGAGKNNARLTTLKIEKQQDYFVVGGLRV